MVDLKLYNLMLEIASASTREELMDLQEELKAVNRQVFTEAQQAKLEVLTFWLGTKLGGVHEQQNK